LLQVQRHIFWNLDCTQNRDRPIIGRYLGFTDILVSVSVGVDITLLYSSRMQTTCARKHNKSKSRQLSCSNAYRCVFIHKVARWAMEHASAVIAETKASSLIRLI